MAPLVTIIICTRNRDLLLKLCIESILVQLKEQLTEILVIDNGSSDNTVGSLQSYQSYSFFNYYFEKKVGLSHARNSGMREAKGEWLVFIDDDAKIRTGYMEVLIETIQLDQFDCFGGPYYAWFPFGFKKWLPENFGTKQWIRKDAGLIDGMGDLLSGGNFAIRKSVLVAMGGFDTKYGMKGDEIGYGEEDVLQLKLLDQGCRIGFIPNLAIDHAVLRYKLTLSWHLQSALAQGRAVEGLRKKKRSKGMKILALSISFFGLFVKRLPLALWKVISKKNYYWQNGFLDSLWPIYKAYGGFLYSDQPK